MALLAASALAQNTATSPPKPPTPPPLGVGTPWRASNESPASVAQKVDASVAALRNALGLYSAQYWVGEKMYGWSSGPVKMKNNQVFSIDFPRISYPAKVGAPPVHKAQIRSNGKLTQMTSEGIKTQTFPVASFKIDPSKTAGDWTLGMPRNVLGAVHGERSLSQLVSLAAKPGSGFTVTSRVRSIPFRGTQIVQRQLLIQRDTAETLKKGPVRIEINIDGSRSLPVSARVDAAEKGKPKLIVVWALAWKFAGNKFTADDFAIGKK